MNPQGVLEPGDAVGSCDEGMLGSQSKSYLFKEDILSMSIPCVLYGKAKHQKLSSMGKQRGVGQSLRARAAKLVMSRVSQNLDHWFDGLSETRK